MFRYARALDGWLMSAPTGVRALTVLATLAVVVWVSLSHVPRAYVDFSRVPLLQHVQQRPSYGTDTIADMYEAEVVLNDVSDMYTKRRLDQTPLEAATWSKEASAPYPPAALLAEAGLYAIGARTGIGFYGMILGLAVLFLVLSLAWFWTTRWYLFPLLYLNCSYFSERFVSVQDGTYLVMLTVVMGALLLARRRPGLCHTLMAVAITVKLSPLYYARHLASMPRRTAILFAAIVAAGLVLPVFVWENYAYIYRYGNALKGNWMTLAGALLVTVPFTAVLWYVEARAPFDLEARVGWGLVPVAMFFGLKMNVARHLLVVLLVPDRRAVRNVAAAVGLAVPALLPGLVRFNSALPIAILVLAAGLAWHLRQIGWDVVRDDLRHPSRTLRLMLTASGQRPDEAGRHAPRPRV